MNAEYLEKNVLKSKTEITRKDMTFNQSDYGITFAERGQNYRRI